MSIDLITMVRRRLDVSHGELLVAIELADAANDDGEAIFVGVERLADRSRQDVRTVQRQLKRLVDVGWLVVVSRGGGRRYNPKTRRVDGVPTTYRISEKWIHGDILPGFEDFKPKFYHRDKGDNLSPLPGTDTVTNSGHTVTETPGNGDTAVSPDSYDPYTQRTHAREQRPSGSRAALPESKPAGKPPKLPPPPPEFNHAASRSGWYSFVHNALVTGAVADGIASYGMARLQDLPHQARAVLHPILLELTDWAVAEERSAFPNFTARSRKGVEDEIDSRIRRELKPLRPQSAAERQSQTLEALH